MEEFQRVTTTADPVRCLGEAFAALPDPRKAKGVRYPLGALLSLIVVALLCGEENPERVSRFAACQPQLLPLLGFRPPLQGRHAHRRGKITAPSNDTIARALAMVEGTNLNLYLGEWLARLLAHRQMVAVDGKSLRGQGEHVLSVYCPALGHVLWQESVGSKENELSALLRILPQLIERLDRVRLFSADAGLCHKKVARIIVEKRREYLLQLKGPHHTDVALAQDSFRQLTRRPALATTEEKRGAHAGPKS
jgi:hypothetical protein